MNEILFRAKRKDNGKWIWGYYVKHLPFTPHCCTEAKAGDYQHYIICDGFSDWGMSRDTIHFQIDPETVGQYIGVKDCRGTKIFEGDILSKHTYFSIRIEYYNGMKVLDLDNVRYNNRVLNVPVEEYDFDEWQITSNIHDQE